MKLNSTTILIGLGVLFVLYESYKTSPQYLSSVVASQSPSIPANQVALDNTYASPTLQLGLESTMPLLLPVLSV